ncbi:4-sulfomuconolactone hydrolase [Brevundimonas subvibrioides]|uniref:Amidohydrolase 2 n=1 Tax=Brevundimonas subvibrioides (strain ATCC 15264 / DSM 4735 / LMG 14903 / NBRC 16000 / CB 81) TaxID=633149 RepID=D9QIN0_BRESC|nr:amidohydrolase family protein [Brevundimonas subvibrioides]ADL01363.1 amidohydrolase 2 [Brevundimonas subvibrioides ATCC 15264]
MNTSASLTDAPIVDCHAHIFDDNLPLSATAWTKPAYAFSAQEYLNLLDAHGVHFGVVAGLSVSGFYNDYMISELRHQGRLRGTAILPPTVDRYVLDAMKADGIVGVRLQLARLADLPDLSDESYRLFFRRVADLDWHVHVAVEGVRLEGVLSQLEETGVKIVLDHFAHPDPGMAEDCPGIAAALRAVGRGRTWVKLSGDYRLHDLDYDGDALEPSGEALADRMARIMLAEIGPDRLLWGSDCPFVGHEGHVAFDSALRAFERWVPDRDQRQQISRTALKLYFS